MKLVRFQYDNPAHTASYRMGTSDDAIAKAAAKWWRDQIDGRHGAPGRDNGTAGPGDPMASPLAQTLVALSSLGAHVEARNVDDRRYDAFEAELADAILNGRVYHRLSCDYGPGHDLHRIAVRHKIPSGAFPWKTTMSIYPHHAKVSAGYGAEQRVFAGTEPMRLQTAIFELPRFYERLETSSTDGKAWKTSVPFRSGMRETQTLATWSGREISFFSEGEEAATATHEALRRMGADAVAFLPIPEPVADAEMTAERYAQLDEANAVLLANASERFLALLAKNDD